MAASVVQYSSANTTVDPSTVALGAAPSAGNTLLAVMASDTTIQNTPFAGTGKTYTQRLASVNNQGFYVWTRLCDGTESATTTLDITGANPAAVGVFEIQGTFDKIGTVSSTINSNNTQRTCTSVTPASADNIVIALAGLHSLATISGGAVDNGFTFLLGQYGPSGGTQCGLVIGYKVTGSTSAVGVTTPSWSGNALDQDGVLVAFSGLAVVTNPPIVVMAPRIAP